MWPFINVHVAHHKFYLYHLFLTKLCPFYGSLLLLLFIFIGLARAKSLSKNMEYIVKYIVNQKELLHTMINLKSAQLILQ